MIDESSSTTPNAQAAAGPPAAGPRAALRWALPLVLLLAAAGLQLATLRLEARTAVADPLTTTVPYHSVEPILKAATSAPNARSLPIGFTLRSGETLGSALAELGVSSGDIHEIGRAMSGVVSPRELRPGEGYSAWFTADSRIEAVEVTVDGKGRMQLQRQAGRWLPTWRAFEQRIEPQHLRGEIDSALESAIVEAGGEAGVAFRMADVLQWDIDFNRDLRRGDRFEVLYERKLVEGRFRSVGDILALRFRNGGTWLEAYRFGDDGGYYDYAGRPLRKMFLRSPVPYSRVTSSFSNRRFHPVLKRYRPHYGVDFGAPTGTPVRVTANGVVRSAGWTNGGGKTVKVGHANGYLTAYLHLSKFASGIASGVRVTQGQIVGYVGSTGLSTAPHLDYRIQQNGRWINPMLLESEPADPVPVDDLERFEQWREAYRWALRTGEPWLAPETSGPLSAPQVARSRPQDESGEPPVVAR